MFVSPLKFKKRVQKSIDVCQGGEGVLKLLVNSNYPSKFWFCHRVAITVKTHLAVGIQVGTVDIRHFWSCM